MLVCRGCCCGTIDKHPETDHRGQLAILQELTEAMPGAQLSVLGCLGHCEHSNLVVVRPFSGAGLVWFAKMLDTEVTEELCRWLRSGAAPVDMSESLAVHVVHDGRSTAATA